MSSQQKISQYSFPQQNFSHQSSFHQCSLNKDLSIQFFLNRSFFLNKSSTVGRTSPQHISLIVSTSNCYVEIKRMSALWFTFGRVLSDLEGSILGNSTNPLGVRWGRSDSERLSPPSSFSSVHFFHLLSPFHQWVRPPVVHPLWRVIVSTGESLSPLESHYLHWRVIASAGESSSPLESHCPHWRVIDSHQSPPIVTFFSPPSLLGP